MTPEEEERHKAALKIQSAQRQKAARRKVHLAREQKAKKAAKQDAEKAARLRMQENTYSADEHAAAVTIQVRQSRPKYTLMVRIATLTPCYNDGARTHKERGWPKRRSTLSGWRRAVPASRSEESAAGVTPRARPASGCARQPAARALRVQ